MDTSLQVTTGIHKQELPSHFQLATDVIKCKQHAPKAASTLPIEFQTATESDFNLQLCIKEYYVKLEICDSGHLPNETLHDAVA